jgi:hypothetical protein
LIAFTDDMTIVGKTPEYLQNSLDLLYKWWLEINALKLKTEIVVFRTKGVHLST